MKTSKQSSSAVIAGYYGFGNAGDELILAALLRKLRQEHPRLELTVLSAHPEHTSQQFGVKAVNRWRPWEWIKPLSQAETFILGGGGLLQESTGPWNHAYYLSILTLAKLFGCRTEVHAIGIDPVHHFVNRLWTRFAFNHLVDYASVRDADSQRALESIGVHIRLWRVPDLIFQNERPAVSPKPRTPLRIAWAIAPWSNRPGWDQDLALLLDHTAEQLHAVNDLLVFFPAQDEALSRRVSELTAGKTTVRVWTQPEDLIGWMQEYALVVSMRYHALALAALMQKPFIGWGYQRKVRTLCRDFDQPIWTFERGWDVEAVYRQISETWRRRDALPLRYTSKITDLIISPPVAKESAHIFVPQV